MQASVSLVLLAFGLLILEELCAAFGEKHKRGFFLPIMAYIFIFLAGSFFEHDLVIGHPAGEEKLLKQTKVPLETPGQFEASAGLTAVVRNPDDQVRFFCVKEKLPEKFMIFDINGEKKILPNDGTGKVEIPLPAENPSAPAKAEN